MIQTYAHVVSLDYPEWPDAYLYIVHASKRLKRRPSVGAPCYLYRMMQDVDPAALVEQAVSGDWDGIYLDVCDWREDSDAAVAEKVCRNGIPVVTNGWPFHSSAQYRRDRRARDRAFAAGIAGFQLEKAAIGDGKRILDRHPGHIVLVKAPSKIAAEFMPEFRRHAARDHYLHYWSAVGR